MKIFFIIFLSVLGSFSNIAAQTNTKLTAAQILKMADDYATEPKDQTYWTTMTVIDSDGVEKLRKLVTYQKGDNKRFIQFLYPEEGMRMLMEGKDIIYVYLPEFKKVRRIATHNLNQTFLGSDFTYEDMNMTRFDDYYDASLLEENETSYLLELTRKSSVDHGYPKLKVTILKESKLYSKIEYYNNQGGLERTQTREDIQNIGGRLVQRKLKMVDHKKNHTTIQYVEKAIFNQGLDDSHFTTRSLTRSQ